MSRTAVSRRLLSLIICIALALTVFVLPQTTALAANQTGTVRVSDLLRVRSGPGTEYDRIGELYNGDTVVILETVNGWLKIEFNSGVGYVSADYVVINQPPVEYKPDADFEAYLTAQGFPESYKPYLRSLHAAHPNWIFKAMNTGLDWNDVITGQKRLGRSLIQKLNSYPESYYSYQQGAYNFETGAFTVFDGKNWIQASESLIKYAVDPRNYLNETYIFAMLGLNYSPAETVDGITAIIKGSFMDAAYPDFNEFATYADAFLAAAKASDVSSYHLASSCYQEQGVKGSQLSLGTVPDYEGYYNFFNVGAYNSGDTLNVVNGAIYAKNKGWDTPYKSILGGAEFIGSGYIKVGQNTKYLHKFDLIQNGGLYSHQYMTNILAAFSEGASLKKAYSGEAYQSNLSFNIPVFTNMPASTCQKPTGAGDNNYLLSSLSVEGQSLTPNFNTYINSYELVVDYTVEKVNIKATAMSNQATISGIGEHTLDVGDNAVSITVTAKTGTQNTYKIIISRQAKPTEPVEPTVPDPTFDGSYALGKYVTGIAPKTTADDFIQRLGVKNGSAKLFSGGNQISASTLVGSGCRVVVYKQDGKEYLSYETVVYGDIDGDGSIKAVDLFMGQRYIFGTYALSGARLEAADINRDGTVRAVDLFMGQRHIFGTYTIDQKG